jgi:hypothetical protein
MFVTYDRLGKLGNFISVVELNYHASHGTKAGSLLIKHRLPRRLIFDTLTGLHCSDR